MKAALVMFPGTNRDPDMKDALERAGAEVTLAWHRDSTLPGCDLIVLPGGFSFGDYLRCGAIAARSPVMRSIIEATRKGVPVLGVCNGFQILIEAGLLPGSLLMNDGLAFVCRDVDLRLNRRCPPLTGHLVEGDIIRVPVAHGEGNYFADATVLAMLEGEGRIVFRYCAGPDGRGNPNGSTADIAGIINDTGRILGMMPHPENATSPRHQSMDGVPFFQGIVESLS